MQLTIRDETWKRFRELVEDIAAHRDFMKNGGRPLCQATRKVVDLVANSDSLDVSAGDDVWDLLIEIVSLANSKLAKLNKCISYEDFCTITANHHRVDCLRAKTRVGQAKEQAARAVMVSPFACLPEKLTVKREPDIDAAPTCWSPASRYTKNKNGRM